MTNEAMNVAIAEACGWTDFREPNSFDPFKGESIQHSAQCALGISPYYQKARDYEIQTKGVFTPYPSWWSEIPDYCNDLNAMHEAEKTLTEEQQASYVDWFFHNLTPEENHGPDPDQEGDIMLVGIWQLLHATAHQRAEALLRTIGKYQS